MIEIKIAVLGDTHIPGRKREISEQIISIIKDKVVSRIILTGDITTLSTIRKLNEIAPVTAVKGEMDFLSLPENKIITIEGFKIAIVHGDPTPEAPSFLERLDQLKPLHINVLISGHTHKIANEVIDNIIHLNPGSATGAWVSGNDTLTSSFMILDITQNCIEVHTYREEKTHFHSEKKVYSF